MRHQLFEGYFNAGPVGGKTLGLYLATTAVAITLAIGMALLFQPGSGADLTAASAFQAKDAPSLGDVLIGMFPTNPIHAMAEGNTLQIIVFAILFGIAISASGKPGKRIADFFNDLNEVIMKLVALLMNIAPYGVFCLMAKLFTTIGLDAIYSLAEYFLVLAGTLILHATLVYTGILKAFTGLSPLTFLKKMEDAVMFAFSTASSNATIPVTMETATHKMGVSNRIASFTVPLGATVNMDGTAIMQGVATVFIAQAFNIDLTMADYLSVILTATLASVGTAGVRCGFGHAGNGSESSRFAVGRHCPDYGCRPLAGYDPYRREHNRGLYGYLCRCQVRRRDGCRAL